MSSRPGAYGMRFDGLDGQPEVTDALMPAPEHWTTLTVQHRIQDPVQVAPTVTTRRAVILLVEGGHAVLDRERRTITLHGPTSLWTDWFVHPTLAAISSVFSNWLGRHAIHAGAFVADGGAWALIGVKQAGKSSTLGWLAAAERSILADDLVVSHDGVALAGPRTLDLLPASARYLGLTGRMVRDGERQRLRVPAVAPEVPLRGWIALAWGDTLDARPIPPAERLGVLIENLRIPLDGPGSRGLLDLAALPGFALRRPRTLDYLSQAGSKILEIATSYRG